MAFPVSHEASRDEEMESGMASTRGRRLLASSSEIRVTWGHESIFSNVDDRVDRGTNQLDFQKIEAMHVHSTTDDRVKRGTNRIDFADHRVDIIAICRCKNSIFDSTQGKYSMNTL